MTIAAPGRALGRYVEPAMWVLTPLDQDPLGLTARLDAVRSLDGPMGPGMLIAALSRLETLRLVDSDVITGRGRVYRLTILGRVAKGSASILKGTPA